MRGLSIEVSLVREAGVPDHDLEKNPNHHLVGSRLQAVERADGPQAALLDAVAAVNLLGKEANLHGKEANHQESEASLHGNEASHQGNDALLLVVDVAGGVAPEASQEKGKGVDQERRVDLRTSVRRIL